jgi:hypothetical protein
MASMVGTFCLLATTLLAERAPRSPAQLLEEAELVVVGRIADLQIRTERSHIETGFGNYDWAIDVTLQITNVEKKRFEGNTIVARCFRIKSRKSVVEYMTPSGNHPIAAPGAMVRAHLYQRDHRWRVVYPNGLVDSRGATELPMPNRFASLRVEVTPTGCRSNSGGPWACSLPCPCSWVGSSAAYGGGSGEDQRRPRRHLMRLHHIRPVQFPKTRCKL